MNLLGVHCSVSGGLHHAFDEAKQLHIPVFQIFTRNQRQWVAKEISPEEAELFSNARKNHPVKVIFSHASYLINLASQDEELREKSVNAIVLELERCEALGIPFTVLHPGAAKDLKETEAIENVGKSLNEAFNRTKGLKARIALENTAGQGTSLGYRFEHLGEMIRLSDKKRLGICFDTCHAWAAGYDISTAKKAESIMDQLFRETGKEMLLALHLNDSKGNLGSRLDRHDHIGKGELGKEAFRFFMNEFADIPKVVETPKEDDWDRKNLDTLLSLVQ